MRKGYALQSIGIALAGLACLAALALYFSAAGGSRAAIFAGVFSTAPLHLPTLSAIDAGTRVQLQFAGSVSVPLRGQVILAGVTACSDASGAAIGAPIQSGYYRFAFSLRGEPFTAVCVASDAPRRDGIAARSLELGMIRPFDVAPYVRRGYEPAHELRVSACGGAFSTTTFEGGLAQAWHADPPSGVCSRYLSRYGVEFAQATVLHWQSRRMQLAISLGIVALGVLLGLLATGTYEFFRPGGVRDAG